jgi:hypothetical protein
MKVKRLIAAVLFIFFLFENAENIAFSKTELNDLKTPKDSFYRFGTTDVPELKYDKSSQIDLSIPKLDTKPAVINEVKPENLTYADLSIKSMAMEISKSIEMDYNDMLEDLSLLWQGAAMKSDTIKFAIYKLSNPDKDKPDDGAIKKVLSTIAGMSTFLGAGSGNPIVAGAALIGGNTLGIMSEDTKALNYKYSKVTDADMIILVRKVDELQQKVVDYYYDYMTARILYDMTTKMVKEREVNFQKAQNSNKEVVLITDTFYREAVDEQVKARGTFFEKRSQLEQLVGSDVLRQFEEGVDKRFNG